MKRDELLRRIAARARKQRVEWRLDRQGTNHEIWRCGAVEVALPRHRDINEVTGIGICKSLEAALGEGWWRS